MALHLQDALGVDAFNCSSEALVADALFDAYRSADDAAIRKLISSKPIFLELDNQVNNMSEAFIHKQFCWFPSGAAAVRPSAWQSPQNMTKIP